MYKKVECKDGFGVSVQASRRNYCTPENDSGPYTAVELGFPTASDSLIIKYAENKSDPTETVYGWVPVGVVHALLIKHGGMQKGSIPPFSWTVEQSVILAECLTKIEEERS